MIIKFLEWFYPSIAEEEDIDNLLNKYMKY
jgi:hypothetical protein